MKFRTIVPISKSLSPVDYTSSILSLGSCFAVNMAEKLDYYKFKNTVNPFGILFHPLAIDEVLHRCVNRQIYVEDDIFMHNELWQSFDTHSRMANSDPLRLLNDINDQMLATREMLSNASHIIITYGTAWVYREKKSQKIVANCHKLPGVHFDKEILSVESIEAAIQNTFTLIRSVNPTARIILTISPVRHVKDGFVENQQSKSNLFAGMHQALESNSHSYSHNVSYFPSYEIMMDELRDYRFYADDMLHPSQMAVDYIWQRFAEAYIEEDTSKTMIRVEHLQKALSHRPVNSGSSSHQRFSAKLQQELLEFGRQHPQITF